MLHPKSIVNSVGGRLASVGLGLSLWAVAAASPVPPMFFDHLTREQGLSQANVLDIEQDTSGFMWFATEDGLNRYDGYEFTVYQRSPGDASGLPSGFVYDVAEAPDGGIWVATDGGGVARLDARTGQFQTYLADPSESGALASSRVRKLAIDTEGGVWLATLDSGLSRLDPESGTFTALQLSDETGALFALFLDRKGLLWVGGDKGLAAIDVRTLKTVTFQHDPEDAASLPAGSVRAIAQDARGNLWVGTYGGGLAKMVPGSGRFERMTHVAEDRTTLTGDRVTALLQDDDGRFWAGTTDGLNLVDTEAMTATRFVRNASDPYGLSDNHIMSLFSDRSGLMWVGTKTRGVNTWNPRSWLLGYESGEGLTESVEDRPTVTSFATHPDGRVWVGTFGDGLAEYDRATGELQEVSLASEGAADSSHIMSLLRDRSGRLWVGSLRHGVSMVELDSGAVTHFRNDPDNPQSLASNGIMSLFEDRSGNIWVGTYGGGINLYVEGTGAFERFQHVPGDATSLSSNQVTAFAQDPSGLVWVGTNGGGLNLMDPDTREFSSFRHDPRDATTLADNTVYDLHIDARGTVWVGTRGGGLDRVVGDVRARDVRFEHLLQSDGLSNNTIYGIEADAQGYLWLATNYGITRYHPQRAEFRVLHQRDGLQSEEFNFGAHHRSDSGELFFGGNLGFNRFDPLGVKSNAVAPLVALTGFFNGNDRERAGIPTDDAGNINVGWRENDVAFEFAALDFVDSAANQYRYQLVGYDPDWIELGTERRVTYTGLPGGRYELRVQGANSDGVWNQDALTLPVIVATAPWLTPLAFTAYATLIALVVLGFWLAHRFRLAREATYSRRLEREVEVRTQELVDNNQELRHLNKALAESSLSDPLTGLKNRRFVFQEVSRELALIQRRYNEACDSDGAHRSELVFMMVDLDRFKPINDTFGHTAGDRMLMDLRDVLLGICRRSDVVVRWGGDEFVVIAKQSSPDEAATLAERIRTAIRDRRFVIGEGQIARTTCSIGYVAYPLFKANADSSTLDQIISMADGLMYEAKRQRDAWVGLNRPDEAITSANIEHRDLAPTSLLYRAHRAGKLSHFDADASGGNAARLSVVATTGGQS